ncbi:MAG: hypothetical protein ACM65M_21870 [Microcoleus sp.]
MYLISIARPVHKIRVKGQSHKAVGKLRKNKWVYLYICQGVDEKYFEDLAIEKKRLPMGKKSDILYIGQYLRSKRSKNF